MASTTLLQLGAMYVTATCNVYRCCHCTPQPTKQMQTPLWCRNCNSHNTMQHFGVVYSAMQLKSDQIAEEVETAQRFNIDQGMFAKFLGLCVRMAMYCLPNRDNYWREG